jgi:hypothetical protein
VPLDEDVYGEAVRGGSLACVECLDAHGCPSDPAAMWVASGLGDAALVAHLHRRGFEWDDQMSVRAAAGGHIATLDYAHRHMGVRMSLSGGCLMRVAAERGHTALLQWLCDHGCSWTAQTCAAAASGGHLDTLSYLYRHGCPWDVQVHTMAAAGGHQQCLDYYARSRLQGASGRRYGSRPKKRRRLAETV